MRKMILSLALVLAAFGLLAAAGQARAERTMHQLNEQAPNPHASPVDVTVQVGDLAVVAWDQPRVEVSAQIACGTFSGSACREAADALRLRVAPDASGRIIVRLDGWPSSTNRGMRATVTVKMPRGAALETQMGVGKTEVSGVAGNVSVQVGVGRVRVDMPERDAAAVHLETGVGMASLTTASGDHETRAPLGAQLGWRRGKGKSAVSVSCGVGRVRVALS